MISLLSHPEGSMVLHTLLEPSHKNAVCIYRYTRMDLLWLLMLQPHLVIQYEGMLGYCM